MTYYQKTNGFLYPPGAFNPINFVVLINDYIVLSPNQDIVGVEWINFG